MSSARDWLKAHYPEDYLDDKALEDALDWAALDGLDDCAGIRWGSFVKTLKERGWLIVPDPDFDPTRE